MDKADDERPDAGAEITLTPDMRPVRTADEPVTNISDATQSHNYSRRRSGRMALWIGLLGLLTGLSGLAAAAWVHTETQAEIRRIASENAQLRLSLDLYARNMAPADSGALTELANRIAVLEESWRSNPAPTAAAPPQAADAPAANEECLPSGMRILVAEGDSYPVCGQNGMVNVAQVANGYIVLLDGTTIASGGSILLPGSPCTIGVTSGGDEGLTGYAEIRVTC